MKILVDENIPKITIKRLAEDGWDVADIRQTGNQGMKDEFLWEKTQIEQRVFVTTDKGFAVYRNENHFGLVIVRLKRPGKQKIHERIIQIFHKFPPEKWKGLMVVMRDSVFSTWRAKG
ncbi:MAG: DUF5615 family PIN-like protein [Thermodesulfobacteriota bacterium]